MPIDSQSYSDIGAVQRAATPSGHDSESTADIGAVERQDSSGGATTCPRSLIVTQALSRSLNW